MTGPDPAVAAVRAALREDLAALVPADDAPGPLVLVACSGGPDSLALAAATAFVAPRLGLRAGAVVVDHGLAPDSAEVAARAAAVCRSLGLDPVQVRAVEPDGPGEAALRGGPARGPRCRRGPARRRRRAARPHPGRPGRAGAAGPGARLGRPLAGRDARGAGPAAPPAARAAPRGARRRRARRRGLEPWHDPTNLPEGGGARRSSVRHTLLPVLEQALGPGVAPALARTADLLRADAEVLEPLSDELLARARDGGRSRRRGTGLDVDVLAAAPSRGAHPGAAHRADRLGSCRPARCRPRTSRRSTPWSRAGPARARRTCPVSWSSVGMAG